MFTVAASNLEEYFAADPAREADLRAVDRLVREAAPELKREFFGGTGAGKPGMGMSLIGYGKFQYRVKSSSEPIDWPIVGLALQKNYLSLYVAAVRNDRYLVEDYAGRLGKVGLGQNCVRFKKAGDLDESGLGALLHHVQDGLATGELEPRYGRVKAS
ncbi:DUF1801 domain-containing protein [Amycolatopsis sp. EV170708-02-1]|uniref:DUF1801 domain-containing protein n=1 Tax=Amycolatopsis sp. EV170708-02-1 TaxID=2919322 RepID=UPI001F0C841C|nr:DUF1801 domain-containing protein [Amycolatopsis sp. EV170708-02-1]UMP04824.1 DUF1801 domain-containing protein [Amycolatopsis sp. EV170708-02-1]